MQAEEISRNWVNISSVKKKDVSLARAPHAECIGRQSLYASLLFA